MHATISKEKKNNKETKKKTKKKQKCIKIYRQKPVKCTGRSKSNKNVNVLFLLVFKVLSLIKIKTYLFDVS